MTDRLERALSDLRRKWVPDHRLGVFDVGVAAEGRLVGATTSREALAALQRLAAEAGLGVEVAVLPTAAVRHEPGAVVTAALAPLLSAPAIGAARASDALHGEALTLLERRGEWLRVRTADGYHAWTHAGYLATGPLDWLEDWTGRATGRAVRAELRCEDARLRLPLGAPVALRRDGRAETADGRLWNVVAGAVRPELEWRAEATFLAAPEWALRWYGGVPYALGGRSDWGVDCSGLVQETWAVRGTPLPRDSDLQFLAGREVPLARDGTGYEAGDLLFFADGGRVAHVALWAGAGRMVHAALARGGVGSDDLLGDSEPGRRLRANLVGVRRVRSHG